MAYKNNASGPCFVGSNKFLVGFFRPCELRRLQAAACHYLQLDEYSIASNIV